MTSTFDLPFLKVMISRFSRGCLLINLQCYPVLNWLAWLSNQKRCAFLYCTFNSFLCNGSVETFKRCIRHTLWCSRWNTHTTRSKATIIDQDIRLEFILNVTHFFPWQFWEFVKHTIIRISKCKPVIVSTCRCRQLVIYSFGPLLCIFSVLMPEGATNLIHEDKEQRRSSHTERRY